jgi:hypothetical protein
MSIAIHSQRGTHHTAAVAAMSRRHEAAPDDATSPERSTEAKAPKGRHALMNALSDALATLGAAAGTTGETAAADGTTTSAVKTPEQKEALHAFAHELFNALRPTPDSTGKGHHGRGFAWGRTSLGDLAERVEALAQKLTGATAPSAGTAPVTPTAGNAPTTGSTTGASAATATPTATSATPTVTAPATTTTSAAATTSGESVLLSAFRRLTASLNGSAPDAGAAAASPAEALAALLHRMAQALVPDAHTEPPASGSLVDVTA